MYIVIYYYTMITDKNNLDTHYWLANQNIFPLKGNNSLYEITKKSKRITILFQIMQKLWTSCTTQELNIMKIG